MRRRSVPIILLVLCIVVAFFVGHPRLVEEDQNKVVNKPPNGIAAGAGSAQTAHHRRPSRRLALVGTRLLDRSTHGHVDIPV